MSRKSDVLLLVIGALEEARRSGIVDSPPICNDGAMIRARAQTVKRPTRSEVETAVDNLAGISVLLKTERDGFVDVALSFLATPAKQCALLNELFGEDAGFTKWLERLGGYQTATISVVHQHHIWGGKTRVNKPSNLLPLCAVVHEWVHTVEPVAGRIACVWKRMHLPEFDWAELDHCAGHNVRGWVDSHPVDHEPFRSMRREIIECQSH